MVMLFPLGSSGPGGNFFFEDRPLSLLVARMQA